MNAGEFGPTSLTKNQCEENENAAQKFWEERLRDNLDESGTGCSGFGLQFNRWLYRLRAYRFRQVLKALPFNPVKSRVLDVGCGAGFYIRQWNEQGVERVEGLDFSQTSIDTLQGLYPQSSFHLADISDPDLPLPSTRYDYITAFDVLFHIIDDEKYMAALKNLQRMLKPTGLLILSENFTHHEHARGSDYHYSRSLAQIERMLEISGLRMSWRRPMFVLMNAPDDSDSRVLRAWWRLVRAVAQRGESTGWLVGAALYPLDRLLTSWMKESPTTEIAICHVARSLVDDQQYD